MTIDGRWDDVKSGLSNDPFAQVISDRTQRGVYETIQKELIDAKEQARKQILGTVSTNASTVTVDAIERCKNYAFCDITGSNSPQHVTIGGNLHFIHTFVSSCVKKEFEFCI